MAFSKVTLNGDTLMDVTQKTVTAATMLSGTTALKNDGTDITGSITSKSSTDLTASGATVTAPAGYYSTQASKSVASGTAGTPTATKGTVSNHSISVTPSVTNTTGYITGGTISGTAVTVSASELVSGTKTISASGTTDVTNYASASVAAGSAKTPATSMPVSPYISVNTTTGLITASLTATKDVTPTINAGYVTEGTAGTITVSGSNTSQLSTQAGTTITPTESEQTAVAANKYTLGAVKVGGISSTYVGSGIDQNDSSDLTVSGATVTAPAGYYATSASKSVASGSATTPATTITANPSMSAVISSGKNLFDMDCLLEADGWNKEYLLNGDFVRGAWLGNGTFSENDPLNRITTSNKITFDEKTVLLIKPGFRIRPIVFDRTTGDYISANPWFTESYTITDSNYPNYSYAFNISRVTDIADEVADIDYFSRQVYLASSDYYGPIKNVLTEYPVGTGIPIYGGLKENTQYTVSLTVRIDSEQGTNNGLTVVAYYSDDTHANVCGALRNQTTWTRISGTTTSGKTVTSILISYSNGGVNVWHIKEAQIEEGSTLTDYTPYAIQANVSASVSASQSVTPTVSAGYVSSGTAGTVSVSGSGSDTVYLTDLVDVTQSAQTIHPSTTDQTIASGTYLTGAQTIKAVTTTNLTAANIVSGVTVKIGDSTDDDCVASVTGTASSGYSETLMKNYIERASSFTDIDWPSGMTKIGSHAFAGCASFNPSSLPSGITSIAAYAFYDCTNLPLTSLPSGITSIGAYAFSSCTNLALTSLPSGVTRIYDYTFNNCTKLALTSLPSGVTAVGDHAFSQCTSLALTSLPSGVTSISNYAFAYCTGITSISCSGTITTLVSYSFTGSSSYPMALTSVSFPNMTVSSLSYAFGSTTAANACQLLAFADIGSTKAIASSSFANCYALQTLVLRRTDAICSLGNVSAFLNTPLRGYNSLTAEVYVPNALISTYQTATNWSTLYNNGTITFKKIEGSDYDLS